MTASTYDVDVDISITIIEESKEAKFKESIQPTRILLPMACGHGCCLLNHVLNMEFLSQPDLMLYKLVNNTVRAHDRENHILTIFCWG